jgi:hypothetical protein
MKASLALFAILGFSLFLLGCVQPGPSPTPTPGAAGTVAPIAPGVSQVVGDADALAAQADQDLAAIDKSFADASQTPGDLSVSDADALTG